MLEVHERNLLVLVALVDREEDVALDAHDLGGLDEGALGLPVDLPVGGRRKVLGRLVGDMGEIVTGTRGRRGRIGRVGVVPGRVQRAAGDGEAARLMGSSGLLVAQSTTMEIPTRAAGSDAGSFRSPCGDTLRQYQASELRPRGSHSFLTVTVVAPHSRRKSAGVRRGRTRHRTS